jgi:glycosyltransferase involved in cell wall biosynthesis
MQDNTPKVSIGMPVYNGEKYIREALDSLLAQTFTDFELIISDNASTDRTEAICLEYAKNDSRIRYVRQDENKGMDANSKFVLDEARGEYFMWAAHDDVRSPDFILVNLDFLCRNLDFVASTSPVRFNDGEFDEIKMGDASLTGEKSQRIVRFFRGKGFHSNGRFYSLMRRNVIKDCYVVDDFLGKDWAIVLHLTCKGKLNRSSGGWVVLGRLGCSNNGELLRMYKKSLLNLFFPFFRLFLYVMKLSKKFSLRDKSKIIWALVKMNMKMSVWNLVWEFRFIRDRCVGR